MVRHERDVLSLMAGVLAVLVAGAFLLGDLTELRLDGRWVGPVLLLLVGGLGLAASLRKSVPPGS